MELLQDNIQKIYMKYLLTAFGSAIISCIYTTVDVICVGQYEGPDGTAALACVSPIWSMVFT